MRLPRTPPWLGEFLAECDSFPVGAHDDQVDAMSQALTRHIWLLREAPAPPSPPLTFEVVVAQQLAREIEGMQRGEEDCGYDEVL